MKSELAKGIELKKTVMTLTIIFLTSLLLIGCDEFNTTNPTNVYKYWAGEEPPNDLKVLKGQYWESAHWTGEYIMYLKLEPTNEWWNKFLKQNYMSADTNEWAKPNDAPTWFIPSDNSIRYIRHDDYIDQGSRYFKDTITGVCYIFEIQL